MRVVNVGIICTSRQDIQSLVKFQAVILVKLPCVYSTASTAPIGPLAQLAIRMQSLAVINDAIEKGDGRQASLPQKAMASCLFVMSEVLNHGPRDPKLCWFPV